MSKLIGVIIFIFNLSSTIFQYNDGHHILALISSFCAGFVFFMVMEDSF